MVSRFLPYAAAGVLSLALAAPVFGQHARKYKSGYYDSPDRQVLCNVLDTMISCRDKSDRDFYFVLDDDKLLFFGYGKPSQETRINIAYPNQITGGNSVRNDSETAKEMRQKCQRLITNVVKPGNIRKFRW